MNTNHRSGFSRSDLAVVLGMLVILAGLALPGLVRAQAALGNRASVNNMRQLGIALHSYHDTIGQFPTNNDANHFSVYAHLLPYIEQNNVYQQIDFKKPLTDKANVAAGKLVIKVYVSPNDVQKTVRNDAGPTNYLFCAGNKPALTGNNGIFPSGGKVAIGDVTGGASNTVMIGETLKGDGSSKATDVRRQHVTLKKDALANLKDASGMQEWKDGKNIAGDRCASWLDGRFLQSAFTGTRLPNAAEPDVNCEGFGGLSALRSTDGKTNLLYADGHVSTVSKKIDMKVWKAVTARDNKEAVAAP